MTEVCGYTVEIKHIPGHQRCPPWEKMLFIFWLCCLWRYCSLKRQQPGGGAALTVGCCGAVREGWDDAGVARRRGAARHDSSGGGALLIIIQGKQRLHKNEKCKMMMICFATRHSKTTWSGLSEPWGRGGDSPLPSFCRLVNPIPTRAGRAGYAQPITICSPGFWPSYSPAWCAHMLISKSAGSSCSSEWHFLLGDV